MRINLLYPVDIEVARDMNRTELPPLGMLYVASALEREGHDVKVVGIDENTESLPESDVDGLAITSSTTYSKFKNLHENVLSRRSTIKVAGNTHACIFPRETLLDLGLDVVVRGEAEKALSMFLSRLSLADSVVEAVGGLEGFTYLGEKGEVILNPVINRVRDLDNLTFPARHLMNKNSLLLEGRLRNTSKF